MRLTGAALNPYPAGRLGLMVGLSVALLVTACATAPRVVQRVDEPSLRSQSSGKPSVEDAFASEQAQAFLLAALQYKGKPYRFGGTDPAQGFDCSGLVHYVAKDALGRTLPRSSRDIAAQGLPVAVQRLAPGDLVFFNTSGQPNSHVGIYAGSGRFLHAPSSNSVVRLESMHLQYWKLRFTQARRLF